YAAINGRDYVTPDDVKAVAADVMAHRLILKGASYGDKLEEKRKTAEDILEKVSVPKDQIWSC
ncbi:MAG: magnesium chelatase, partial [Oscillospiraceae bacterium]|nr:magnesium chelatase [Oscillospiraceae bacterium]